MTIGFHVVCINVGHHRHHRQQIQERGVRFIGFHHDVVTRTQLGIGARTVQSTANDKGRIQTRFGQNAGHQAGRGGFTVGTRNGDALLHAHQFRQHDSARHHRNMARSGDQHFGVIGLHGGRSDHGIGTLDVLGTVSHMRLNAQCRQTPECAAVRQVRA